jgi:hypothetical protein
MSTQRYSAKDLFVTDDRARNGFGGIAGRSNESRMIASDPVPYTVLVQFSISCKHYSTGPPERCKVGPMKPGPENLVGTTHAVLLRQELSSRNSAFSASGNLPFAWSRGEIPVVVYEASSDLARHGNFLDDSCYIAQFSADRNGNVDWTKCIVSPVHCPRRNEHGKSWILA